MYAPDGFRLDGRPGSRSSWRAQAKNAHRSDDWHRTCLVSELRDGPAGDQDDNHGHQDAKPSRTAGPGGGRGADAGFRGERGGVPAHRAPRPGRGVGGACRPVPAHELGARRRPSRHGGFPRHARASPDVRDRARGGRDPAQGDLRDHGPPQRRGPRHLDRRVHRRGSPGDARARGHLRDSPDRDSLGGEFRRHHAGAAHAVRGIPVPLHGTVAGAQPGTPGDRPGEGRPPGGERLHRPRDRRRGGDLRRDLQAAGGQRLQGRRRPRAPRS